MTPNRPYLIRAFYQWIIDNDLTPHIIVDAHYEGVDVPSQFIDDGRIIFNVSPSATPDLELENEWVYFNARFSGKPTYVAFPVAAVLGIFAKENNQGMLFPAEADEKPTKESADKDDAKPAKGTAKKPSLKLIK